MNTKGTSVPTERNSIQKSHVHWSNARLQNLFGHYNRRFWKGKLRVFKVVQDDSLVDCLGQIEFKEKLIRIKVLEHPSDRRVRSTVLHEMAHLAAGRPGHNSAFFEQLENLLRQKAPILMDTPENANRKLLESIPKKFRICRESLRRTYARRHREIEREIRKLGNVPEISLESAVLSDLDSAGLDGVKWTVALAVVGDRYGLLDIDGKPLGPEEERLIKEGKKVYLRQRSIILSDCKMEKERPELKTDHTDKGKVT